jgi:putative nucleotidyltransferase with HDIG domain
MTPSGAFDILDRLRRVPFFASLSETALMELAAHCPIREIAAMEILFHEGDSGDSLYIVLDGEIQITHQLAAKPVTLGAIAAGDFFGEMVLFDHATRSATARAVCPTQLLEIQNQVFHNLLHTNPQITDDVLRIVSRRLRDSNTRRLDELVRQNRALEQANRTLQENYAATLNALSAALDLRDQATQGHSQRVTAYTLLIAEALHVPERECEALRLGALLHDIGKIGVSDAILRKPTTLTPNEWAEMRKHPEWGAALVDKIDFLRGARDIIIAHHEHYDGSGYPNGLSGEAIPLGARIFAVADVFDAVTTFRPYREPMAPSAAAALIRAQSGTKFDPRVIAAFERALPEMIRVMRASFAAQE